MFEQILSEKLSKINDVYAQIHQWLMAESSSYRNLIKMETQNDEITPGYLADRYKTTYAQATVKMNNAENYVNRVYSTNDHGDLLELSLLYALLYYVYRDVQQYIFSYNTVMNKVLIPEYLDRKYLELSEACPDVQIDYLEFLTHLDRTTQNSYLKRRKEPDSNAPWMESDLTIEVAAVLSEQKKWEREYSSFLNNRFTPAILLLRGRIHNLLAEMGIDIPEEDKYCLWRLLPFVKKVLGN